MEQGWTFRPGFKKVEQEDGKVSNPILHRHRKPVPLLLTSICARPGVGADDPADGDVHSVRSELLGQRA